MIENTNNYLPYIECDGEILENLYRVQRLLSDNITQSWVANFYKRVGEKLDWEEIQ